MPSTHPCRAALRRPVSRPTQAPPAPPRAPIGAPLRHPHRPAHGGPRHHHRERRPAPHPAGPGLLGHRAVVGAQRLHPHLRGAAAPRGPGRRPARPAPHLPDRHRPLLAELAGRRLRHHRLDAAGRPCPSGDRRRLRRPIVAGPAHHRLPGRRQRVRAIGLYTTVSAAGGAIGPGGRRAPHRVGVVALGHVRERPHRSRRLAAGPDRDRRDRTASGAGSISPAPSPRLSG